MSLNVIKYAFVAGEISPTLFGRSDLEKYDLGVALARNFFVDYRGGLSTRPGTEFGDYILFDDHAVKLFPFKYGPTVANTNVILFGHTYIRFIQENAYVLEADKTVSGITKANPGVVTSTAHGFSNGDWVYFAVAGMVELNGRPWAVVNKTTNTFELHDVPYGAAVDTSSFGTFTSGVVNRVYTVSSPYTGADLEELQASQRRDYVRLTHPNFVVRNLVRSGAANWALSIESVSTSLTRPVISSATATGSADYWLGYVVTAVNAAGEESLGSNMFFISTAAYPDQIVLAWSAVTEALYYNVYRTIAGGKAASNGDEVGYIGRSYAPLFSDVNIVPDFTKAPPRQFNPFANGAVESITITAGGSSYSDASTVSVAGGGGSGFVGSVITLGGVVVGVLIINRGSGYSSPVVTISGGGTGATATATLTSASGNNPITSTIFQQRQIYAGSVNEPLTLWGSRPGFLSNFDGSPIVAANDSYEFEIDSEEVAPIQHLVSSAQGLLILSQSGIWLLHSSSNSSAVTPTDAGIDIQSRRGSSPVPPIPFDTDLLYIEGKSPTIRLLSYVDTYKVFGGRDMSILSNHLFPANKPLVAWAYAQNPFNVIYAVRSDGALLAFTLVKEQDVYAWTQCYTEGLFEDVTVVQENDIDATYFVTKRYINSRWTKFFERLAPRSFEHVEDSWCVDCGLRRDMTYPAADLTISAASGSAAFTASASVFALSDVGKVIRAGGGKATITGYTSGTVVTANIVREITEIVQEDGRPLPVVSGDWTMDSNVTELSGLWHLEGEVVQVLADGNVVVDLTVVDGAVTLPAGASNIVAGLKFTCIAQTLPPTMAEPNVIEGKRKSIVGSAVRVHDTRGLQVGATLSSLYPMKERTTEAYGEPTVLQRGFKHILIQSDWDDNGQTLYVQDQPLPATILGLVTDMEVGDDSR